jgi:hypothetical protein
MDRIDLMNPPIIRISPNILQELLCLFLLPTQQSRQRSQTISLDTGLHDLLEHSTNLLLVGSLGPSSKWRLADEFIHVLEPRLADVGFDLWGSVHWLLEYLAGLGEEAVVFGQSRGVEEGFVFAVGSGDMGFLEFDDATWGEVSGDQVSTVGRRTIVDR